jgi:hypothetical protein
VSHNFTSLICISWVHGESRVPNAQAQGEFGISEKGERLTLEAGTRKLAKEEQTGQIQWVHWWNGECANWRTVIKCLKLPIQTPLLQSHF